MSQDDVRPYHAADFQPGSRGYNGWCSTNGCVEPPVLTEVRHSVTKRGLMPRYFAHCVLHVWDPVWRGRNRQQVFGYEMEKRIERFRDLNNRIWGEGNWIPCVTCPTDDSGFPPFHHKDAH